MAATNKSTRKPCWKCGSRLHDSTDCGVPLEAIRSGAVQPYRKPWKRRRKCAYCACFGIASEMIPLPVGKIYRSEAHFAHHCCHGIVFSKSNRVITAQPARFGQIRRGGYFLLNGREWKRTRGIFAIPVVDIGKGHSGWPFKVNQPVTALSL